MVDVGDDEQLVDDLQVLDVVGGGLVGAPGETAVAGRGGQVDVGAAVVYAAACGSQHVVWGGHCPDTPFSSLGIGQQQHLSNRPIQPQPKYILPQHIPSPERLRIVRPTHPQHTRIVYMTNQLNLPIPTVITRIVISHHMPLKPFLRIPRQLSFIAFERAFNLFEFGGGFEAGGVVGGLDGYEGEVLGGLVVHEVQVELEVQDVGLHYHHWDLELEVEVERTRGDDRDEVYEISADLDLEVFVGVQAWDVDDVVQAGGGERAGSVDQHGGEVGGRIHRIDIEQIPKVTKLQIKVHRYRIVVQRQLLIVLNLPGRIYILQAILLNHIGRRHNHQEILIDRHLIIILVDGLRVQLIQQDQIIPIIDIQYDHTAITLDKEDFGVVACGDDVGRGEELNTVVFQSVVVDGEGQFAGGFDAVLQAVGEDGFHVGEEEEEDAVGGGDVAHVALVAFGEFDGGEALVLDEVDDVDIVDGVDGLGGGGQCPDVVVPPLFVKVEDGRRELVDPASVAVRRHNRTIQVDILPQMHTVGHTRRIPNILEIVNNRFTPIMRHHLRIEEINIPNNRRLIHMHVRLVLLVDPVLG